MKRWVSFGVGVVSLSAVGCGTELTEPVGHKAEPIVNGFMSPTNVGTNAVKFSRDGDLDGSIEFTGNGIVLNDHWILTAAHVVAEPEPFPCP